MRKLFFTFFAVASSLTLSAQDFTSPVWATFEDGDPIAFENFENEGGAVISIISNPSSNKVNKSDKCLSFEATDQHDWWHKVNFKPAEGVFIKPASPKHVYLHFKSFRTRVGASSEFWLYDVQNNPLVQKQFNNTKAGVWEDIVFDVTGLLDGKEVAMMRIQPELNFDTPVGATTYLFDDFKLVEDSYPDGVEILTDVSKIFDFDNESLTAQYVEEFKTMSSQAKYAIVTNPNKTDVNSTNKVLRYNKPAKTVWWHGLDVVINGLIDVKYPNTNLHVMAYSPDGLPIEVVVEDHSGKNVSMECFPYDAHEWEDFVIDISSLQTIKRLIFRLDTSVRDNWDNPAGLFYMDDVVLNDNTDPRETTRIKNETAVEFNAFSADGKIYVKGSEIESATLYSVCGVKLAEKTVETGEVSFEAAQGSYIINVKSANGASSRVIINQ